MPAPAPFLRWAGGKRQLLPVLRSAFPASFDRYYEPFLGGGAVLFALADDVPGDRCVVNDVNGELLCAYRAVRDDVDTLISELTKVAGDTSSEAYYRMRASEPTDPMGRAVRMIYLNRTGFNGLYRVNSKGRFNVPHGKLTNPEVCNEPLLRADAQRLQGVTIREGSFVDAVADATAGDLVYLDPPYIPLTPTASFSRYAVDDFREPDQRALADTIRDLTARGVRVVLSNSDTPLTRDIFSDLHLFSVSAARSISAKGSSRNRVHEIVGVNFDPERCHDLPFLLEKGTQVS